MKPTQTAGEPKEKTNNITNVSSKSWIAHHLKLFTFCLFSAINLCSPNSGFAKSYYIDPVAGNDSTGNGSLASPWKTINKAKPAVVPGDIVNLLPGSYGTVTFGQAGDTYGTSWTAPITYQNNPTSAPYSAKFSHILFTGTHNFYTTISGVDVENTGTNDACIKTENASYVKIIDCKAHGQPKGIGPSYANIFTKSSQNILIENCEAYYGGTWAFAIQLENSNTVTVRSCHVHDIISSGIRTGGGQNYIIEYNIIHDQRAEWNSSVHGSGIAIHSHNTTIRGNIVYNFGNTRPIRFYQSVAGPSGYQNMLVENNLVYKTADFTGVQWWVEFIDVGGNCVFRNNTIVDSVVMVFAQNADGSGLSLHNNVFTGGLQLDNYGAVASGPGRTKWDKVSEGNNIFGNLMAKGCGYQCYYDKFSNTSNSIVGTNFSVGTFFNSGASRYPYSTGYPYQLRSGSSAINFGDINHAPTTDLLQQGRVGLPDAGCYEYGSSTPPPPPNNQPPVANAGPDQTITDTDGNGSEQIALNGSSSTDSDGTIVSYVWTEGGTQLATGANPTVTLSTGEHTITLTVTDNGGLKATDTVTVIVAAADKTPPFIVSIIPSKNSLDINFDKTLERSSAEYTANYKIDNNISITKASLNADTKTVTLTTSTHLEETTYTLTVSNIEDLAGNKMLQTSKTYTYSPSLIGYWKLNDGAGLIAEDLSGCGNTGTLVNGPTWTDHGTLLFDGIDSYVNCGANPALNLTGSLTITASINPKTFGPTSWPRIVDKGNGSTGYSCFLNSATGSIQYAAYGNNLVSSNSNVITLNASQHIAVVYDKSLNSITFYVDGQQAGTASYNTPPLDSSNSPLAIGIRLYDLSRAFDGQIGNVRIYNRALSSAEISNISKIDSPFAFYPIGDKTVDEGSNLNFIVTTPDTSTQVFIKDHNLPTEPTFAQNIFSWTPTYDNAGSYHATFAATNGQLEDIETITITVNNVNRKPVIQPIGNKSVNENSTLTFTVSATDPDGDPLTYSAQNLPTGAVFSSNTFTWTPTYDQAGSYQVTFIASDGQTTNSQTVTINVIDCTPVISGQVAYWKLNEGTGSVAQDSSGNNNTGTLVNGPTWTTSGALTFDGIDSYVNCGTGPSLNLTSSLTISAWVNPQSFRQNGWQRIVDKGNGSKGYSLFLEENTKSIAYVIYGGTIVRSNYNVISLNNWQHVAVVYDKTATTITFYINGRQAGAAYYPAPPRDSSRTPLVIGIRGSDLTRAFSGLIRNVSLYNRALTANEVLTLYSCQQ